MQQVTVRTGGDGDVRRGDEMGVVEICAVLYSIGDGEDRRGLYSVERTAVWLYVARARTRGDTTDR